MSLAHPTGNTAEHDDTAAITAIDPNADPLVHARAELTWLATARPGSEYTAYQQQPRRPLGVFSDYVCEVLGDVNEAIRAGTAHPQQLLDELEEALQDVDLDVLGDLAGPTGGAARRLACLDLAWAERATSIAFGGTDDYKAARSQTALWRWSTRLAAAEADTVCCAGPTSPSITPCPTRARS